MTRRRQKGAQEAYRQLEKKSAPKNSWRRRQQRQSIQEKTRNGDKWPSSDSKGQLKGPTKQLLMNLTKKLMMDQFIALCSNHQKGGIALFHAAKIQNRRSKQDKLYNGFCEQRSHRYAIADRSYAGPTWIGCISWKRTSGESYSPEWTLQKMPHT